MRAIGNSLEALSHLFFPHICYGCGSDLLSQEMILCLRCRNGLPDTDFAKFENNPIEKIFWGRLQVSAAFSQYYFTKDSLIQTLIHQLKYKGKKEVGTDLGKMMGHSLLQSSRFSNIDAVIPLPLFPDKEKKRGYNQATMLCEGISEKTKVPILYDAIKRVRFTETQTRKSRMERWQNVEGVFEVSDHQKLTGKNILLVDDVITTGATLEACGNIISAIPGVSVFVATLAYAVQ